MIKQACILLIFGLSLSAAQAEETRVALVIGNGQYASAPRLNNPVRDAGAIAKALRETGFQTVQIEQNLTREKLVEALRHFETAADGADWALVYYAGHGIEVSSTNYLVPIDAKLKSDRDVDEEAVSLSQVQKRLEGARKLRLVILDACRDNPFLASMKRTLASRSVGRGLARPDLPQSGSLVAYSAATGQTASDGETGQNNSPYVAALVKNLALPDVEVNLFFRRVRTEVLRATGQKQEPATYESLPDDRFVFRPGKEPSAPSPGQAQLTNLNPPKQETNPAVVLGLKLSGITEKIRREYNIKNGSKGVVVMHVDPESMAADKQIKPGEMIIEVGQEAVNSLSDIMNRIDMLKKEGRRYVLLLVAGETGEVRFVTLGLNG